VGDTEKQGKKIIGVLVLQQCLKRIQTFGSWGGTQCPQILQLVGRGSKTPLLLSALQALSFLAIKHS